MKKIPLTQGKFALVDDEDYEWLNQWGWFASQSRKEYYAVRTDYSNGGKKNIKMHRVILGLTGPKQQGDHINGITLDNRRGNLRAVTNQQNSWNQKPTKGSSKFKGVSWKKEAKKWVVQLMVSGKKIHIGYFNCEIEAAHVYDQAAIKYYGEFKNLNFPQKENK